MKGYGEDKFYSRCFAAARLHILIFVEVSLLQRFGLRLGVGIVTTTVLPARGRGAVLALPAFRDCEAFLGPALFKR
jgi:hypothetical protein